ncbi:MAG: hypothetical protein ACRDTC_06250 [Pseudonocardiaceae bacterium]
MVLSAQLGHVPELAGQLVRDMVELFVTECLVQRGEYGTDAFAPR